MHQTILLCPKESGPIYFTKILSFLKNDKTEKHLESKTLYFSTKSIIFTSFHYSSAIP